MRPVTRRTWAWRSYAALLIALLVVYVAMARDPYSDPRPVLELAPLVLLFLTAANQLYFRREWADLRREWVERHPWLRYVVSAEDTATMPFIARTVVWVILVVVILAVWMTLIPAP